MMLKKVLEKYVHLVCTCLNTQNIYICSKNIKTYVGRILSLRDWLSLRRDGMKGPFFVTKIFYL